MKFIVTKELGRLARWLRILGFDTIYFKSDNKGTLILEALREDRIIITRSKQKRDELKKKTIEITSCNLEEQLKEIIIALNIKIDEKKMFTRCTLCNEPLVEVEKESVKDLAPEYVYKTKSLFMKCPGCNKIYWHGSHWGRVKEVIELLSY
jgi:uncharacterized protein with PIN domain